MPEEESMPDSFEIQDADKYEILDPETAIFTLIARSDQIGNKQVEDIYIYALENKLASAFIMEDGLFVMEPAYILPPQTRMMLHRVRMGDEIEIDQKILDAMFFLTDVLEPLLKLGNALR